MLELAIAALLVNPICIDNHEGTRTKQSIEHQESPSRERPLVFKKPQLKPTQLRDLLIDTGFEGEALPIAWAIVMRESRGNAHALRQDERTKDDSWGLFQINMRGDLGPDRRAKFNLASNEELLDPKTNASVAFHMSGRGKDFGAWGIGPNSYREDLTPHLSDWLRKYPQP